ncbi:glycerophosphoryl diester phosphodiesterase membrane domain-containing protein [Terrabacter carboxydivorans]|uniref:Membrane protein n=1 Tax=Terrabacter carboxydivorans TaxID=619730 RepID=A0ABP5YBX0_9MICO
MSDQQGWTAPGASTPPDDASRDALSDVAMGTTSDPDPTADAGWGPPVAPTHGAVPTSDAPPPPPPGPAHASAPGTGYPVPTGAQATPAPGQPVGTPPPGWTPPQLAPKPGIIPLRPLTLGEIWSGVMTAVRGNPAATIGLALVTTAVVLVPLTLIGLWIASSLSSAAGSDPMFDPAGDAYAGGSGLGSTFLTGEVASFAPALATYVTALLLPLFMAVVIGQGVQGRRIGLGETARAARARILPALGVVLLAGLAAFVFLAVLIGVVVAAWSATGTGDGGGAGLVTFVAVVVGVVGFILFSVRWAFAVTIVVLEGVRPVRALRRSWQLTRKRGFWRIFGIRLLTVVVTAVAGSVVTAPVGFLVGYLASDSLTSAAWIFVLLQAGTVLVQSVLTTPFSSGVDSLLYVDQRIRYEGLDMALLQQVQQGHDAQVA